MRRRAQTSTERDLAGIAARKEREATEPEYVCDDITQRYAQDPEMLRIERSKRKTAERLARLEDKYDRLVHKVIDSRSKIVTALISAVAGIAAGYIAGGCL